MSKKWEPLDTQKIVEKRRKQHEGTTSAGTGGFAVPLGAPLRPPAPVPPYKPLRKKKKQQDG